MSRSSQVRNGGAHGDLCIGAQPWGVRPPGGSKVDILTVTGEEHLRGHGMGGGLRLDLAYNSLVVELPFYPESKQEPLWGFKHINDTLPSAFSGGKVGLDDLSGVL